MPPLARQNVRYLLGMAGVDQRSDDRIAPLGKPAQLQNVRFSKNGRLTKRRGYLDPVGYLAAGVTPSALIPVGEDALLVLGKNASGQRRWYTHEPTVGTHGGDLVELSEPALPKAWLRRTPTTNTSGSAIAAPASVDHFDVAVGANHTCYAMCYSNDSFGLWYWWVTDNKTERVIGSGTTASFGFGALVGISNVRVLAIPGTDKFLIGGIRRTAVPPDLSIGTIDCSSGSAVLTAGPILATNASGRWDWAIVNATTLYVAHQDNAIPTTINLRKYDTNTWGVVSVAIAWGTAPTALAVAVPKSASGFVTVVANEATNGTRAVRYTSSLVVQNALWVVAAAGAANFVGAAELANGNLDIYTEQNNASSWAISVNYHANVTPGSAKAASAINSARLASKPILPTEQGSTIVLIGYTSQDGLQHSLFAFSGASMVARFTLGTWKGSLTDTCLPNIQVHKEANVATTKYVGAALLTTNIYLDQDGQTNQLSGYGCWFDMDDKQGFVDVDDEQGKLITGGYLQLFDGTKIYENGFLLAPEIYSATGSAAAGSLPASGTFNLKAVYKRQDRRGRIHRSAASTAFVGTTGVGQNTLTVGIRAPTFSTGEQVEVELYRTANGGTSYYLADVVTIFPNKFANVAVTVTGSDTALTGKSPLLEQGAVRPNYQPSCPLGIATTGRRVLVIQGDDARSILESKERPESGGIAFIQGAIKRITPGGDVTALGNLGERWVAWKKRKMYAASGEGPGDDATGDNLSEFEELSPNIGCTRPRSIVQTTHGTLFRSELGFYLLSKDGGLVYLGAPIETEAQASDVVDAAFDEDANLVYFLLANGNALVLHIFASEQGIDWRWTTDTSLGFSCMAFAQGRIVGGKSGQNTSVLRFQRARGQFAIAPDSITTRIRTGWIPLSDTLQGRGRLYAVLVLGRAADTGVEPQTSIYFDLLDTPALSKAMTRFLATIGGTAAFEYEVRPNRQQHQAVQVQIEDTGELDSVDDGFELTEIVLRVGVDPETKKLQSSRRAT